jgi:hypothetical protein
MDYKDDTPSAVGEVEPRIVRCDLCDTQMIDFNCELVCLNCGFRRDCSDP